MHLVNAVYVSTSSYFLLIKFRTASHHGDIIINIQIGLGHLINSINYIYIKIQHYDR